MYATLRDRKLVRAVLGSCVVGLWGAFEEMLIHGLERIETVTGRTIMQRYWNAP